MSSLVWLVRRICRGPAAGYISLFVNRRWIQNRRLAFAVDEAYQGLLMTGRHPLAVLNLQVPHEEVDVNVHPTKAEVRFRDEGAVFGAIQRAVRTVLLESAPVPVSAAAAPGLGLAAQPSAPLLWEHGVRVAAAANSPAGRRRPGSPRWRRWRGGSRRRQPRCRCCE